uniref:Structural maintenance of chromosomes protein n=1 Tax=Phallusia mammillata TaxID=59560 RepID=A0A6F9DU33_9ASCI|nr:structural maintenance of chromosomes protein 2-like [Phallusia mammillata]
MYIKSVTIDGFKSYAQRTVITGFDPLFNAITGLNGSGKSNILDAICFLLGITNLSHVRASNLQDLVYKNGQAGITKAAVSITFDNSNKEQSPMGMEAHNEITITRQIVIGGRNKYLINGVNAQNSRVSDLFRSVGLNVNNPHFLIMQGRVTKVMNMKPPEILSMIEEATGTSMYESKKDSAQKMIEKKENKLAQINQTLNEEITPTLQKLRDERASYLEYQKVQREVERLTRLLIAYQFMIAENTANNASGDLDALKAEKEQIEQQVQHLKEKFEEMTKEIQNLEHALDSEAGVTLKELENNLGDSEKAEAKAQSDLTNQRNDVNAEKKKLKNLQKSKAECEATNVAKNKSLAKLEEKFNKAENESKKHSDAYTESQNHFQAVSTGLAKAHDGIEASWNSQLLNVKKEISEFQSELKKTDMRLKHANKELKPKQSQLKNTESSYKRDESVLKQAQQVHDNIQKKIDKLDYEDGKKEELIQEKRNLTHTISQLRHRTQDLYNKFPALKFDYRDPERNWDRSRVKGLVAELIDVNDISAATALEVVAGGRLYNVVVDTHETGEKLLKHGQLKRRCTIIPINKVAARSLDKQVVQRAKSIVGADNVNLALSLVGGDTDIEKALEYVFGTTLVCNTMQNANKVAFDPNVKARTVTLAGELFDPSGTLTGGSRSQASPVLAELQKLKSSREELKQKEKDFVGLEKEIVRVSSVAEQFYELNNQIRLKKREIEDLQARLNDGSHGRLLAEIKSLESTINECNQLLNTSNETLANLHERAEELQRKIENAPAERARELKEAESEMKRAGALAEKSQLVAETIKEELSTLRLEMQELTQESSEYDEQIKSAEESISQAQERYLAVKEKSDAATELVKTSKLNLKRHRDHIQVVNRDIQERTKAKATVHQEALQWTRKNQEQESAIDKHIQESKDASDKVSNMLEEHDWIKNDRVQFGKTGSAYDFSSNPPKEAARRLEKLQETQERLSRSVNMRAMSLLGKAEEKYNELVKKKRIVENDKAKIHRTIEELDQMKNEAVTKAYVQVNKNFSTIFSALLPGATAKLAPPEGGSVLAGLEFHVGFGDVWKTNLNELSGGQRSLVALSLILAMLLLKPAPIYILDEVDAALDLSHTQNIGGMLREHFKHSQFIVVSLKDGMFNNANVLFRTKFVDGVSTVNRYAQSITSTARNPLSNLPLSTASTNQQQRSRKQAQV